MFISSSRAGEKRTYMIPEVNNNGRDGTSDDDNHSYHRPSIVQCGAVQCGGVVKERVV